MDYLGASLVAATAFIVFRLATFLFAEWTSPLHALPGPPNASLIYGNMKQIWEAVRDPSSGRALDGADIQAGSGRIARKMD
jgi:hypothetical protein